MMKLAGMYIKAYEDLVFGDAITDCDDPDCPLWNTDALKATEDDLTDE